jgi:hypothetical protein
VTSLRAEDCNMPVTLGYSAVNGVLQMADAIRLVEEVLSHEAAGRTIVSGRVKVRRQGLVAHKSVGNALQDLALAGHYYELIGKRAGVPAAADLASIRRPIRELRTAEKRVSRRRDAGS